MITKENVEMLIPDIVKAIKNVTHIKVKFEVTNASDIDVKNGVATNTDNLKIIYSSKIKF